MNYKINWSNIKDGYKGFEKLAVRYVQCNYDSRFKRTGDTRDGNKDARFISEEYTIVMGFQSKENDVGEWWMEAKFSKSKELITRYRLDATLVSAILQGNVERIIFVTNINVNSQTVNDIRQAITCTTCCKEADFCTRDCLEYWLYQNPKVLGEFFYNYHNEQIELPSLMLIEQMEFFAADKSNLVFRESLNVLEINCTYMARFSVYSNDIQELLVRAGSHLKGIEILHQKKLHLDIGVNYLEIHFRLSSKYGYNSKKKEDEHFQLPAPSFKLGSLSIVSKKNIVISTKVRRKYSIPSQTDLLQQLIQGFKTSQKGDVRNLFCISGQSGVGKSYVLDTFIEFASKSNTLLFACDMSKDQKNNVDNLVRCVDFIYFPFLPADSVNKNYLDSLKDKQYFSPFYYDITCCERITESVGQLLSHYLSEDICFFPRKLYVNPRLIIIDNIHNANDLIINVIYKIAMELLSDGVPCMIILSGQQIKHTKYYTELLKTTSVFEHELCITYSDCFVMLEEEHIDLEVQQLFKSNFLFSNMIELLFFVEYILDHGSKIKTFNTFATLYHLFFREKVMDSYIKRLFMDAVKGDTLADQLCNEIYWNASGVDGVERPEGQKLLSYHVVKIESSTGRLIPYHDIYTDYYRKNYNHRGILEIPFVETLEVYDVDIKKEAIKKIHQAFKAKQFIFVYYSLEPIYRNTPLTKYRNLITETEYYTLFYEYALSCAHCSLDYSGQQMFARIYTETETLVRPSHQIRKIRNATLWELTNSTFESLNYGQANAYAEELVNNTSELIARHVIKGNLCSCERYHNANIIRSMIKSEFQEDDNDVFFNQVVDEMLQNGFQNRCWSYRVRYSLTLMQQNPQKTISILSSCCDYYDNAGNLSDKYLMWAHFYLSYMRMIVNDDIFEEDNALLYMDQLHNSFFNDYRKIRFGMATYFYYKKDIKRGDSLLLSDSYVLRPRRPRLQGFFYLTNAVRYMVIDDEQSALSELENASKIFSAIPSYNRIIQHNISVLKKKEFFSQKNNTGEASSHIYYYLGGELREDTYYLDIRSCW